MSKSLHIKGLLKKLMTSKMPAVIVAIGLGLGLGSATMTLAKPLSKILADSGLTPDDFTIMMAKGETLYNVPNPQPKKVVSWTNPDSGSYGRVRLASVRGNCVFIQYFVFPKGSKIEQEIRSQRCKSAEGDWLMVP